MVLFETLPHTADLKVRAYGSDMRNLFTNMLEGMFMSLSPISIDGAETSREFDVSSHDLETLFIDFLSEALSLSDVYKEVYLDVVYDTFEPEGEGTKRITGTFKGVKIEGFEEGEIKAVTHHDLKIEKEGDVWVAEVLFDL